MSVIVHSSADVHPAASVGMGAAGITVLGGEIETMLWDVRWMIILIFILVVADLWTGLTESVKIKRENFRFSRAGRRTSAKFFEYICLYIIGGALIGKAVLVPLGIIDDYTIGGAVGAAFACLWEIDSIAGHLCKIHGIRGVFSIKQFIVTLLKKKYPAVGEAVEEGLETEQKKGGGDGGQQK